VADRRRRGAVVHGVEDGPRIPVRLAPLGGQELVDVGSVILEAVEGEAPDKAVGRLDHLLLGRHLVEVAEDQLITWEILLIALAGLKHLLAPARGLRGAQPRWHPILVHRRALLLPAGLDQRAYRGDQRVALGPLGGDHRPALCDEVVGQPALAPQVVREHLRGRPHRARVGRGGAAERGRVIVGVDEQQLGEFGGGHARPSLTRCARHRRPARRRRARRPIGPRRSAPRASRRRCRGRSDRHRHRHRRS
jgi:hypothetical protein